MMGFDRAFTNSLLWAQLALGSVGWEEKSLLEEEIGADRADAETYSELTSLTFALFR